MRKIILLLLIFVSSTYAQNKASKDDQFVSFGAQITKDGAISKEQMTTKYGSA